MVGPSPVAIPGQSVQVVPGGESCLATADDEDIDIDIDIDIDVGGGVGIPVSGGQTRLPSNSRNRSCTRVSI
ncbi:hypothetical protein [Micrococcus terreus]|uniref:hypothetical protein n=1 Tax=Micrococcus terreus TaxID=574650 RepID=UPI00254A2E66|nr:hypothetical protein [Micrococcus terreus]WOO99073.1 hypothetical protein R3I42_10235 [Micrococcus terreus]